MKKLRNIWLLPLLVQAGLGTAHSQSIAIAPDVRRSGQFTIGNSLAYAPFEYTDASGKPGGLDIELATAAAHLMGAKLNIINVPIGTQIPSLMSGRIKVDWAPLSVTKDRLRQVDFVAYMQTATVASTLPEKAAQFREFDSLCGRTISVQTGSVADFATDKLSASCKSKGRAAIRKQIYPSQQDVIQSVLTGRADVSLDDSTSARYYELTSKGKLVVTSGSLDPVPLGIAIAKGDKATDDMMVAAFKQLFADGTYAKTLAKYNMSSSAIAAPRLYNDPSQIAN